MILDRFLNILISPFCVLCKDNKILSGNLCSECLEKIPFIKNNTCLICGMIPEVSSIYSLPNEYICGDCKKDPPFFEKAIAVAKYEGVMKQLIIQFKYHGKTLLIRDFLTLILSKWEHLFRNYSFDLILHVPLHITRLKQRGYDQSYIIAHNIARYSGCKTSIGTLERIRNTTTQTNLNRKERIDNVKNAFIIKQPQTIKNKQILLIDDVFTTGATINECTKILIKSGAKNVIVLTLARA